jgi:uncharacterized membrane protein
MLTALDSVSGLLLLGLALLAFATNAFALTDAIRQRADAFQAAGKLTKQLWLIITGVAAAIGFVYLYYQLRSGSSPAVFSFPNIIAFVASAVYLADVRPAVRRMTGGRGGTRGPYGGW